MPIPSRAALVTALTVVAAACASGGSSSPGAGTGTTGPSATTVAATAVAASAPPTSGPSTSGAATSVVVPRPPAPTTTLATDPSGLAATLEQYRSSVPDHRLEIQFVHRGTRAVRLDGVRLVWPGLEPAAPSSSSLLVSPGQIVDLSVDYGESVCGERPLGDEPLPGAPAVAEATATWPDTGEVAAVRIPVTDVRGVLARVFAPGCRKRSVTSLVTPGWEPTWTDVTLPDGRPALAGALRLDRVASASVDVLVRVTAVSGSVLLTVTPTGPAAAADLVTLAPGQTAARLPVVLAQSGNCAPHALAESKQTFLLGVTFVVGDRPEIVVDVVPDQASKDRLTAMINRSCGVS